MDDDNAMTELVDKVRKFEFWLVHSALCARTQENLFGLSERPFAMPEARKPLHDDSDKKSERGRVSRADR